MTDPTQVPDVHDGPLPDLGHESLRLSVLAALDDLTTKSDQLAGALLLVRTSLDFAQTFLDAVVPLQQAVTAQAEQIADLQTRLSALETPPPA